MILDQQQAVFAQKVADATGLNFQTLAAWALTEGGALDGWNYLHCDPQTANRGTVGYSGAQIRRYGPDGFAQFRTQRDAEQETAWLINNMPSNAVIRAARGLPPSNQLQAVASSPWSSTHYGTGQVLQDNLALIDAADLVGFEPPRDYLRIHAAGGGPELVRVKLGNNRGADWLTANHDQLVALTRANAGVTLTIGHM